MATDVRKNQSLPFAMTHRLTRSSNREEWRYTGPFTRWNRFKGAFPGLGIATVAFTVYLGYEYLFLRDKDHGEGHGVEKKH